MKIHIGLAVIVILCLLPILLCAQESPLVEEGCVLANLKGISLDMRMDKLIESWGFPAKRENKGKREVWYYTNENTPHPTDGIIVYFHKDKVRGWRVAENMYEEMDIWGKEAGAVPRR